MRVISAANAFRPSGVICSWVRVLTHRDLLAHSRFIFT